MKCCDYGFRWPSIGSAVVEQLTHHFKFEGSNPVRMEKKFGSLVTVRKEVKACRSYS
jgi:hypothetical protein